MGDDGNKPENEGDKKVVHVYPLIKVRREGKGLGGENHVWMCILYLQHSDMTEEMRAEAIELTITACEKFAQNYEVKRIMNRNYTKKLIFH